MMKHFRPFNNLLLLFAVFVACGCAAEKKGGEVIHVQKYDGLSGYTIRIRNAKPSPVATYKILKTKDTGSSSVLESDKKDNKQASVSPLYYYRSSNPNRLTRVRLRRFY
jgi:hypothetical protein